MFLLGIESSCDETAAAVVYNGKSVLSSVVVSQMRIHNNYGGVVPEIASRKHVEAILPVVYKSVLYSGLRLDQLAGVVVTRGPGLVGSLLVGFTFAKSFAFSLGIPFIAVNHLKGHINSIFLNNSSLKYPFVALLVSGGHTVIYYVTSYFEYEIIGQTRDDAVGEAYDKVSKMLGLGYPGGEIIEKLSKFSKFDYVNFKSPLIYEKNHDFSFSGIKSAVNRYLNINFKLLNQKYINIITGFQNSIAEVLSTKVIKAALNKKCTNIVVVGGVASNKFIIDCINRKAALKKIKVYVPLNKVCGDNAVMISVIGYRYLLDNKVHTLREDIFSKNYF